MSDLLGLSWTLNVVALGVGSHLAVALFLLLRYLDTHQTPVGLWAAAYALLTGYEVAEVLLLDRPPAWLVVRHALVLVPAVLLYASFPQHRPRVAAVAGVAGAASAAAVLVGGLGRGVLAAAPASLVAAAVFLTVARAYRQTHGDPLDLGARLIVAGFALTGLLQASYPLLRLSAPGTVAGGAASGVFTLVLGVGLVLRAWHDTRELELMNAIARVLNRFRSARDSLQETLRLVCTLLGVESGWIFLRERDGHTVAATWSLPERLAAAEAAAMTGDCRCLSMLSAGQLPLAVNIVECQRMERVGLPHHRHASVPLRASTSVVGLMNLVMPGGRTLDVRQLQMLSAVGHQIGLAVERSLLFEEVAAKERLRGELIEKLLTAHEDERRRIARELHDEAGQALTALIVNLELAAQEQGPERLREHLGQLRALAERTLAEIRRLIYDLRPSILDDLGLVAALRWYAKNLLDPRGIRWTLSVSGISGRLPGRLETVAFRLVQEALTNVLRHAEATDVVIAVSAVGRELHVRIEDNGRGFDARRPRPIDRVGGFGLLGMQERVELVGGRWQVQSTPGVGTVVSAVLPIQDEGAAA